MRKYIAIAILGLIGATTASALEVKGYKTERDNAKWSQFPNKLITVVKSDIINITKNSYKLPL